MAASSPSRVNAPPIIRGQDGSKLFGGVLSNSLAGDLERLSATLNALYAQVQTLATAANNPAQASAAASTGNTIITLGSLPVTDSVQVFVDGLLLNPATDWTLSGTKITLTSALSAADAVVVFWLTQATVPGGIKLS